ncbi:MAG: hypothetical protein JOZ18_10445, partial [Chloroflexi bacterium]|nr:hypothetical protein [Chloroflexota bacterium]
MIDRESSSVLVRVWLLGTFRAERRNNDGNWEAIDKSAWDKNYARQLFVRLLCAINRRAARSDIIDDLWSERPLQLAEKYLNNASSRLASILGHEHLLQSFGPHGSGGYGLAGQERLWTDIDACECLLQEVERRGRTCSDAMLLLEQASQYFERGAMLEGESGQWCLAHRTEKEAAMRCCLIWLAEGYEAQGMLWHARKQYRTLLALNPFDEDILCRLLALLHRHGMIHEAHDLYEETKRRFMEERLSLTPATKKLAEKFTTEALSPDLYLAPPLALQSA